MLAVIQLEAQAKSAGGTYTWSVENESDFQEPFLSSESRCQFRAMGPPSFVVTVKYQADSGDRCEDQLRIHVHGIVDNE